MNKLIYVQLYKQKNQQTNIRKAVCYDKRKYKTMFKLKY